MNCIDFANKIISLSLNQLIVIGISSIANSYCHLRIGNVFGFIDGDGSPTVQDKIAVFNQVGFGFACSVIIAGGKGKNEGDKEK